ncbi:uracil-DNA glycosylase [Aspergillus mulundensis]|uniref:Uracil-DNA glycosylase n=1 Tax=Aspergillus mulundensis TaxID=1810919 RepID=A0A3D8RL26_9EURO|nr:Uracil-DNA glycosylase [Aspergillus mulundensis]RDW74739.1 Uracil-DNA glycosylase [Aspergillus mulundensis]
MARPSLKRGAGHLTVPTVEPKKPKADGDITSFFGAPRPKSTRAATANQVPPAQVSPKFNKPKWVATLTPEQKELLQLEIDTMDESWLAHLKEEIVRPEFLALKRFLQKEKQSGAKIFPPEEDVYSWSRHTPLHKVKVVIVGQDPYHNHNQAHGLAFSVRPPTPAPPSLVNIYNAIKNDYPSFLSPPNKGGLLIPWAERGVLLLNTCLTVRAHQAASHSNKGWERLTQKAIDVVNRVRTRGVVFLAWGNPAGKRITGVNHDRHYILQSCHPSPLSAHRGGFLHNQHFKKCNEWLAVRYGPDEIIDWSLVPQRETSTTPLAVVHKSPVPNDQPTQQQVLTKATNQRIVAAKLSKPVSEEGEFEEDLDALEALAASEASIKP